MKNTQIGAKEIIKDVLENPSRLAECYSLFHDYSILNALAIRFQCAKRNIECGPTASFKKWKERGVQILKGQKALSVCIPFLAKSRYLTHTVKAEDGTETVEPVTYTAFMWRPCVFTYSQTNKKPFDKAEEKPRLFDYERACRNLGIKIIPYDLVNGNTQGFSNDEGIAINPLGVHKTRTAIHEIAHHLLHKNNKADTATKEVEAEMVSFVLGSILGLDGAEESRGYIRHWLGSNELQEKTAMKAICLANKIYQAGR